MVKTTRAVLLGLVLSVSALSAQAGETKKVDVLLVGGGIMSSTLGVWLHELEPDWSMMMVERLDGVAQESSNGWNNAGTGHSALAELNYTPEKADGRIDISTCRNCAASTSGSGNASAYACGPSAVSAAVTASLFCA